jgi:hypothetical protein
MLWLAIFVNHDTSKLTSLIFCLAGNFTVVTTLSSTLYRYEMGLISCAQQTPMSPTNRSLMTFLISIYITASEHLPPKSIQSP